VSASIHQGHAALASTAEGGADRACRGDGPSGRVVRLDVRHTTVSSYTARVEVAYHCAHLTPRDDERQQVERFRLTIDPPPAQCIASRDSFGNVRTEFSLYVPHQELVVGVESRVTVRPLECAVDESAAASWEQVAAALRYVAGAPFRRASEFVYASPYVPLQPLLTDYARPSFPPGRSVLAAARELMQRIHRDFSYEAGVTEVGTPLLEVFRDRRGVCQDFAHLMIAMLRGLGLPARYVSGYLLTRPPPGRARLVGADASHAWVSIWCPNLGWIDLDPTNAVLPETDHVTLAIGRDYGDVMPLRGVIQGGASHTVEVAVDVVPAADFAD
jgi:transglutaminase-like putative cysteine protease